MQLKEEMQPGAVQVEHMGGLTEEDRKLMAGFGNDGNGDALESTQSWE